MKAEALEYDNKLRKNTLSNGLTYYVYQDNCSGEEVSIALVIKVGSLMENENEIGISHFTEHFCIHSNMINPYENQIKHRICGYTKFMETVYLCKCSTEKLADDLYALKNILSGNNFSEAPMEEVRSEVCNEIFSVTTKANYKLKEIILPQIIALRNLKNRMPIGKVENINIFDYDSILRFHHKWYKPTNASIIVTGNFNQLDMEKYLIEAFSDMQNKDDISSNFILDKIDNFTENKASINIFQDLKEDEIQFYYSKPDLEYETKLDLEKKIFEYFQLNFLSDYISEEFTLNDLKYKQIDFVSQRILKNCSYNVLQLKVIENLKDKLEFAIKIIRKLALLGVKAEKFNLYKENFLVNLNNQYQHSLSIGERYLIKECIDNYLYNEPVISIKQEYDMCNLVINKIEMDEFNIKTSAMLKNKDIFVAINSKKDPGINIKKLIESWNLILE